jgi:hypothetical protein
LTKQHFKFLFNLLGEGGDRDSVEDEEDEDEDIE